MIECKGIKKFYQQLEVLKGIDLSVKTGEFISIIGASGAGKSTLLHIIGSLDQADEGTIQIDGTSLNSLKLKALAQFRNKHIGFIFQFHHLLPEFSALENVCLPGLIAGRNDHELKIQATELLYKLAMENRLDHKPGQLSGGEQQRVALARALINNPKILLADEPTGNLDEQNAKQVLNMIMNLKSENNMTVILVTHDTQIALNADRTLTMRDGRVVN
ncbi:MAG: ABC transporter ATP-binding protein [Saprospiraceae bacterium]|nr:ABC transporter ATP-binding protein [Saprospiraceae bacterium]MBK7736824.1 ABC transporter ATP-binding protein [Saprospiraceae bacterium]MBK7914581.1 ABC transporter ATP-binding protein [Saprospiraceae bacterium]